MSEHHGRRLRKRIGEVLDAAAGRVKPPTEPRETSRPGLEERVAHLEALVEGLQDAVHREAQRHDRRIADIERKTEPEELARALSADARRRGL
jgi:hypothetical protein